MKEIFKIRPLNDTFDPMSFTADNFPLMFGRKTQGESQKNLVQFDSKVVSRQHAEFSYRGGGIYVRDSGSSSGTFVNGKRLSERGVISSFVQLENGDQVQLGEDHDVGGGVSYKSIQMVVYLPHAPPKVAPGDQEATITLHKAQTIVKPSISLPTVTSVRPPPPLASPVTEDFHEAKDIEAPVLVYNRDNQPLTVSVSLNTHTRDLLKSILVQLNRVNDLTKFELFFVKHNLARLMKNDEKPLFFAKRLLEQMGFDGDTWKDQLKEDHTHLFRFIYSDRNPTPTRADFGPNVDSGVVDLSNRNCLTFPSELFPLAHTLVRLDLSGNPGMELPTGFAQNCMLSEFSMARSQLTMLPPAIFCFSVLSKLELSQNQLQVIPPQIASLAYLKELNLRNNQLKNIPDEFSKLESLANLDLSNNQLDFLPKAVVKLLKLTFLDISFNQVCYLPIEIARLKDLKRFLAVHNKLAALPFEITELTSLQELDLRHNNLNELDGLPALTKLERFLIDGNRLLDISIATPSLSFVSMNKNPLSSIALVCPSAALLSLSLEQCKLTTIPDSISEMFPNLQALNLSNNQLNAIPDSVSKLRNLSFLQLGNNALVSLPHDIGDLTALTRLDVRRNSLRKLPTSIWKLPNLLFLNASSNFLETFPLPEKDTSLGHSLKVLQLGDNKLTNVYGTAFKAFSHLQELITLNLSFNSIADIAGLVSSLPKLEELHISGNGLRSLEDIDKARNLRILNIAGNELVSLPGGIAKLKNLTILDARFNLLKYDTANWPEEWNWNWNLELKHLDFSGNKEFEISPSGKGEISDFSTLSKLELLGMTDVTLKISVPTSVKRKGGHRRTSPDMGLIKFALVDTLGKVDRFNIWDLVLPNFRNRDEHVFAIFDGHFDSLLAAFLSEKFASFFSTELAKQDNPVKALKHTFLLLNNEAAKSDFRNSNTSGLVAYLRGKDLHLASVGDSVAVLSRASKAVPLTPNHSLNALINSQPTEIDRIRNAGGALTRNCQLDGEVSVSRAFGLARQIPIVNADPHISTIKITSAEEFVIIANNHVWNHVSYQMAVDIAHSEGGDWNRAALKIRDLAVTHGASGNLIVLIFSFQDLIVGSSPSEEFIPKTMNNWRQTPNETLRVGPPLGRVVLVFTDIKSSTMLWEKDAQAMHDAVAIHNRIMRDYLRATNGYEVKTEGDAFMVAFWDVVDAVDWCITVQLLLMKEPSWPSVILESPIGREERGPENEMLYRGVSVRMGIHVGSPVCEMDPTTNRMDYFGPVVNRAARVSGVADGGEIFISAEAMEETMKRIDELKVKGVEIYAVDLGEYNLKGLGAPEHLFVIYPSILKARDLYRKKKDAEDVEKGGLIKYIKLSNTETMMERYPCVRVVQDVGRETTVKGKLCLTPSYVCFVSKSKGFLKQKDKETLAMLINDIKEVKKVDVKTGPSIEIATHDGSKVLLSHFSSLEDTIRKVEQHRRLWVEESSSSSTTGKSKSLSSLNVSMESIKMEGRKGSEDMTVTGIPRRK